MLEDIKTKYYLRVAFTELANKYKEYFICRLGLDLNTEAFREKTKKRLVKFYK